MIVGACNHPTREGACRLDAGHRGQHRVTGVWFCDGCGRARHGTPAATGPDGEYPDAIWICIVCVKKDEPIPY